MWKPRTETVKRITRILGSYSKAQFGLVAAGILLAVVLVVLPLNYNRDQVGAVLTTLTIVQASILGIVFSVSILGVQLIANRYSPRMMKLVTTAPVFIGTLALFSISAIFALFCVLTLPYVSPSIAVAEVAVSGGLAGAFGIGLKQSVETILERSTPEGILDAYRNEITVEGFRNDVRDSKRSFNEHPLHDLHELIMGALSRHEWSTAKNGITSTIKISVRIIEEETTRGNLNRPRDDLAREYFEDPLEEQLPRTAHRATETGQEDLAEDAIDAIRDIATAGIDNNRFFIVREATSGINTILREAPDGEAGRQLRRRCLNSYRTLLDELLQNPASRELRTHMSSYSSQIRIWLGGDHESWEYEDHLSRFYRDSIANGFESYLGYYGAYLSELDVEWGVRATSDEHPRVVSILNSVIRDVLEINIFIFRYIHRNDEWPLLMTALRDGWLRICRQSVDGPAELTQLFIRFYIDTAYMVYRLDPEKAATWSRSLADTKSQLENGDIVDDAFDTCADEGLTPRYGTFVEGLDRRQEPDSKTEKFYQRVTGTDNGYSVWLESFRTEVETKYEEYYSD